MKRYRHTHNNVRSVYEPTALSWFILLSAWTAAIILAAFMIRSVPRDRPNTNQIAVSAAFALQQNTDRVLSENTTDRSASCSLRFLPAVRALRSDKPTILIYHTHTTEAYTQTESDQYREKGKWRTDDNTKNIVAVGEVLKEILERDYGFQVIHDTTDHEPPKLSTAYERSLVTMQRYHEMYPSVVLFIDLHRDAYTTDNAPCDYITVNGIETAKLMLVVGKGTEYDEKPYYEANMAFAERITDHLNTIDPKLCRPVRVKTGRYNQHVAPNCILVEAGHNANTLAQAKAAMPYLAESIAYSFFSEGIASADWVPN